MPVKVSANNSTPFMRHQGSVDLVAVDTIRIVFLWSASSKKNRLHRTVHVPSRAALSFGKVDPRASHATHAIGFTCWRHNCHVIPSWRHLLTSSPVNLLTSFVDFSLWRLTLTRFDRWLLARVNFLQSRCSLPSFSRRFHFCSLFLHILFLNEE